MLYLRKISLRVWLVATAATKLSGCTKALPLGQQGCSGEAECWPAEERSLQSPGRVLPSLVFCPPCLPPSDKKGKYWPWERNHCPDLGPDTQSLSRLNTPHTGGGAGTLSCLSSSSASSVRFLRKEETRRDLKSMSSGEKGGRNEKGQGRQPVVGCCQPSGLTLPGRVREALEVLAAQLLAALSWSHFPVLCASLVQRFVGILVVSQCPKSPV